MSEENTAYADDRAFPFLRENNNPSMPLIMGGSGLTKREWFAGMALQGLCVNGYYMSTEDRLNIAMSAYQLADAMLKEGAK
jgi:hypothetical protein